MASVLNEPYFNDEQAAFDCLEAIVWPNGPVCPKCGCSGRIRPLVGVKDKLGRARIGLKKCYDCRTQITVRIGTIFERSHVPLHIWFQAAYLLCASKKGISSNQLSRTLGVTLQTAWFMGHRLREAMRTGRLAPMGGAGQTVEVDETFIGRKAGVEAKPGWVKHKHTVLTLVERGGSVRSFHIDEATKENIVPIVRANLDRESHLMTDEARRYEAIGKEFASHGVVDHSRKEYGYTDRQTGAKVNTNTVEGYYSIFKRGMKGVYQHCNEKHFTAILPSSIFGITIACGLGLMTQRAQKTLCGGSWANG